MSEQLFEAFEKMSRRPKPFEHYTAKELWTDDHVSSQMLEMHLNPDVAPATRKADHVRRTIDWMISRFEIARQTRICDLGCGPGLYTLPLAEHGASVTGIDFSTRSIEYARRKAAQKDLGIDYQVQDYLALELDGPFDLVTLIYLDFCVLDSTQRAGLLDTIHDLLAADGRLMMDVLTPGYMSTLEETHSWEAAPDGGFWSASAYHATMTRFIYETEKLILDKHTIVERDRTREIYNWFQCLALDSLESELAEHGLQITGTFADTAGAPWQDESSEMTIVAERIS